MWRPTSVQVLFCGFVSACPLLGTQHTVCCFPWWLLLNTMDYVDSLQPFLKCLTYLWDVSFWGSGRLKLQWILEADVTILLFSSVRLINCFVCVCFIIINLHIRWNTCLCFHISVLSFETFLSIIIDFYSNTVHFSILSLYNYHVSSDPSMSRRLLPVVGLFYDNEIFPHLPSINHWMLQFVLFTHTLYSENIIAIWTEAVIGNQKLISLSDCCIREQLF